jgi:hypothetical protein
MLPKMAPVPWANAAPEANSTTIIRINMRSLLLQEVACPGI